MSSKTPAYSDLRELTENYDSLKLLFDKAARERNALQNFVERVANGELGWHHEAENLLIKLGLWDAEQIRRRREVEEKRKGQGAADRRTDDSVDTVDMAVHEEQRGHRPPG